MRKSWNKWFDMHSILQIQKLWFQELHLLASRRKITLQLRFNYNITNVDYILKNATTLFTKACGNWITLNTGNWYSIWIKTPLWKELSSGMCIANEKYEEGDWYNFKKMILLSENLMKVIRDFFFRLEKLYYIRSISSH